MMLSSALAQLVAIGIETRSASPDGVSQPPQLEPPHHWCHILLSEPFTKMSSRFGPQATGDGQFVMVTPAGPGKVSIPPHVPWNQVCCMAFDAELGQKMSSRP